MTPNQSPELALTIACCRWPRSPQRNAAVSDAAAAVSDWDLFDRLVQRHRVTPLARDALRSAGVTLPRAVEQRIAARAGRNAVHALAMARESVRLQRAFDRAGLPSAILKGVALGVIAYGDPCLKESWDIDLLTTIEAVPEARALLEECGYELRKPAALTAVEFGRFLDAAHEAEFKHRESGLTVDLHWGLTRNSQLLPAVTVHSETQAVRVADAEVRTFADEPLFAYLCTHGTKHGWTRLKWLADFAAYVSGLEPGELERLYRAAKGAGAGSSPATSLLLSARLLGVAIPSALAAEVKTDARARLLTSAALHHIGAPYVPGDPRAPFPWRLLLAPLLLAPGWKHAALELRNIWDHPLQKARFGSAMHVVRIPLWFVSRGRLLSRRVRSRFAQSSA